MSATATQETEQTSIQQLWQNYRAGSAEALDGIKVQLDQKILENPQAAALVASQIIGDSPDDGVSLAMATDAFKRASACVQMKNPVTLVNMFAGCSDRMGAEHGPRVIQETRSFLGQISRATPDRKFVN